MRNKKWIFPAVAVFSIALTACSEKESASDYILQAKQGLQTQQTDASIIALKNAIKVEPSNSEARYLLGSIYLNQGNAFNAVKELEKAKLHKFDTQLLYPKLARAYFLAEEADAIYELTSKDIKLSGDVSLPVFLYQIITYLKLEQLEQAKKLLRQSIQLNDQDGHTLLGDAYILFYEQNIEDAKQKATEALSKLPALPEALMLLGNIATVEENYVVAAEYFEKYLKLQPLQRSTEIILANVYLQQGKFDLAEMHADKILKLMPQQAFANHIKAMVRIESRDYEAASEHAEKALANNFKQATTKLVAGVSAFYLNNYEQANYHLKPLMRYLPVDHFARRMLVVSQLELGIIEDVADNLGTPALSKENEAFYASLSYKLLQAGATDEAKKLISSLDNTESATAESLLREGVLKALTNDKSALKSLEKAIELDPKMLKAELLIARMAIKSGDVVKAQQIASKWQAQYPDKPDGYNIEALIELSRRNVAGAKALLEKSLTIDDKNVYALVQLSQLTSAEGELAQAKAFISQALEAAPDNINVLRQYYRLTPDASSLAKLKEKSEQNTDNISYRLLYAEALIKSEQVQKGLNVLQDIIPDHKTPKFYWMLKLAAYRYERDITQLKSTAKQWQKISPYQIEPVVLLAEIHRIEQDYKQAIVVLDAGLEKHKDNITLSLVKIDVLIRSNQADDARKLYLLVSNNIENEYIENGILGRLALLDKLYSEAIDKLEPYYKTSPNVQKLLYLVQAYIGNTQQVKAIEEIDLFLKNIEFNEQLAIVLGNLYIESGNKANALKAYEKIIEQKPNNVIALNNAAWLSMENNDLDQANVFAEKAFELAPENPSVVDTHSQVLFKQGRIKDALASSSIAFKHSKGEDMNIRLNYIELLLANKRLPRAERLLAETTPISDELIKRKQELLNQIY
ncbi:XrtA/PEP-CTERM system TPR-repeat protein PrsT [Thalassotalea atypica]|uniref:XrtA/PEP-CTERM system TPR-repeat protein PrsT n=1 Tax=Thalassotalea atypica TaxID=2054316 RepID=UPI0025742B3D|nr:XrtA/PEP-CTERM system TPR-repeat protein PrsT [Thalassotalea atypica]